MLNATATGDETMGDDSVIAAILTASMCSKDKKMGYEGYMTSFRTFLHLIREELRKDREALAEERAKRGEPI